MDEPDDELNKLECIIDGREKPHKLDLAVLRVITDKFSDARIIGHGGCGVVYKGILRNGTVAVKRLSNAHTIDNKMFHREVNSMMMVNHINIVRFLGYCSVTQEEAIKLGEKFVMGEIRERLLCFVYMNNGSLQKHINDEFRGLKWHERYKIIEGICEGLHYIHKEKSILHMDLKPDNILLGDNMVPKITDFGLARLNDKSQTASEQRLVSLGYCAPEYLFHGKMSFKSDIYSLGVIILELVTGSKADPNVTNVLRRWRHRWNKSSGHTQLWYRQVTKCLDLAQWCKQENPICRPYIWDIISELEEIDTWNGQTKYATLCSLDEIMSSLEDILGIEPLEMHIPFALNKHIAFSINVTNDTDDYFAFRIATPNPLLFSTQPEECVVPPRSELCVTITLKAQDKALLQSHRYEFNVESCRIDGIPISIDVTRDMFDNKVGKVFDEVNVIVGLDVPQTSEEPQMDIISIKSQQPQMDIESINSEQHQKHIENIKPQDVDEGPDDLHLGTDKESLGPSYQIYQGSKFMAKTIPHDLRLSDTNSILPDNTLAIDTPKQSYVVAEWVVYTSNPASEHPRLLETSVSPRKEFHLQNLDLATIGSTYWHSQKLKEIMLGTPPRTRGGQHPTTPVGSRAIGQCPGSTASLQDDLQRASSLQPIPSPPGSTCSPSRSLHWNKGKLLGCGTYGQVYLGLSSEGNEMCAIKEVKVISDASYSIKCLGQLHEEIGLLSQLSHPNIVQYYDSNLSNETLSVYLEYVSGGSIHKLLQQYGPFGEATVLRNYTAQILSGLAYLHGRNTVHRDIRGANILVDPNGDIKLADFGIAKHISVYSSINSFKGIPYWTAPEVIMMSNDYSRPLSKKNDYNRPSVDIWSLGCTIVEMATAKPPWSQYEGVAAIFKIGNSKGIPDIPDHLSYEAKDFLELCLQRNPAARPTAAMLMNHPFVKDYITVSMTTNLLL